MINYRKLLKKYMEHIIEIEGTSYLHGNLFISDYGWKSEDGWLTFTLKEADELRWLDRKINRAIRKRRRGAKKQDFGG